jgi:large subunit ribosomal protein L30
MIEKTKVTVQKVPKMMAIVRVRGDINVKPGISATMKLLRLHRKHRCVVVPATQNYMGMISKVKDYCTFGEVDEATLKDLLEKRGRIAGDKPLTAEFLKNNKLTFETFAKKVINREMKIKDIDGVKQFFKLHPPIGGFARAGIKKPFAMRGVLGYRRTEINKLLRKMI